MAKHSIPNSICSALATIYDPKVLFLYSLLLNVVLITTAYIHLSASKAEFGTYSEETAEEGNLSKVLINAKTVEETVRTFDYKPFSLLYEAVFFNKTKPAKTQASSQTSNEKFTIVILAYKRDDQLNYTLNSLDGLENLDKIIVIWNDVSRDVRKDIIPVIHVPIVVLKMMENSLNNRFLPIHLIETEAVLNMDDDFNVKHGVMNLMFDVWKSNPRAIVGPNHRYGTVNPKGKGEYGRAKKELYNMVLTSGAFIHRDLNIAYTTLMHSEIHSKIDEILNCEDIAINFLVAHLYPQSASIKIGTSQSVGKFEFANNLHGRKSHYTEREKCIENFSRIYGRIPLVDRRWKAV